MTSFLKTQLASYLEKFIKNFERDQLKLSITKGRFELTDLEFDADLLTSVLELPTWMKLATVSCNRLYVKIKWREIRSRPLRIHLDQVEVTLETCPELRTPEPPVSLFSMKMPNMPEMQYRLPHKVIDGAYITVNNLHISFTTSLMKADIQLLHLRTYPSTPEWKEAENISHARVKNSDLDETLIFRQIDFDSVRVELASVSNEGPTRLSRPITILALTDKVKLVMKRRLSDAAVLAVKMDNVLDNIQIVLSETEMKATVDFVRDITTLAKASSLQTRLLKAQRKYVAKQGSSKAMKEFLAKHIDEEYNEQTEKRPLRFKDPKARYYMRHTIAESSQHLLFKSINLTIVHDNSMPESFPEYMQYARYADASMSINIENIRVDVYPFHLVSEVAGMNNWLNRQRSVPGSEKWIAALLNGYTHELSSLNKTLFEEDFQTLMSTTLVAAIGSMTIHPVITSKDIKGASKSKRLPFLSFQKAEFDILETVPAIEICRTQYFYAKDVQWPVPKVNMFVSLSPMRISLDVKTVDWMTLMGLHVAFDLIHNLKKMELLMIDNNVTPSTLKTLIRVEAHFPRIFFPKSMEDHSDFGSGIQIQMASLMVTNSSATQTRTVDEALEKILGTNLYSHAEVFPNLKQDWTFTEVVDHIGSFSRDPSRRPSMMCVQVTDMWAGAVSNELGTGIPVPFLDAISMRMWLVPGSQDVSQRKLVWGAAVLEFDAPSMRVQLNDYTLKLLVDASDGLTRLGEVGGEHMEMMRKLGLPELGFLLLMQQENIEVSLVLQSEYGQEIAAGDALNMSNLNSAKEAATSFVALGGASSLDSFSVEPESRHDDRSSQSVGYRSSHSDIHSGSDSPAPSKATGTIDNNLPWWRNAKYGNQALKDDDSDTEATDDDTGSVAASDYNAETDSQNDGYVSDDENDLVVERNSISIPDDLASWSDENSNGVQNWDKFTAPASRRAIPLARISASLFCVTLKSLQAYMMISHGHILVKLRLGQVVTSESRNVAMVDLSELPLQAPDLEVARAEHQDRVLVRLEAGVHSPSAHPTLAALCRDLELQMYGESFRRLRAWMSGIGQGVTNAQAPPSEPSVQLSAKDSKTSSVRMLPVKADDFKMTKFDVPNVDVRITNFQCRLKDVIQPAAGAKECDQEHGRVGNMEQDVKDIRFRINGMHLKSAGDGVILLTSITDHGEEDHEEDASDDIVQKRLAALKERRDKLDVQISKLQIQLRNNKDPRV